MTLNFKEYHDRHGKNFVAVVNGATYTALHNPLGDLSLTGLTVGVRWYKTRLRRFVMSHPRISPEIKLATRLLNRETKLEDLRAMAEYVRKYLPIVVEVANETPKGNHAEPSENQ